MLGFQLGIRIYLREKCLAQMYSVRHFSCYFICIYFVVDDYIDLGQYKWILLQNHCCPEKYYHKVSCLFESSSGSFTGSSGLL